MTNTKNTTAFFSHLYFLSCPLLFVILLSAFFGFPPRPPHLDKPAQNVAFWYFRWTSRTQQQDARIDSRPLPKESHASRRILLFTAICCSRDNGLPPLSWKSPWEKRASPCRVYLSRLSLSHSLRFKNNLPAPVALGQLRSLTASSCPSTSPSLTCRGGIWKVRYFVIYVFWRAEYMTPIFLLQEETGGFVRSRTYTG